MKFRIAVLMLVCLSAVFLVTQQAVAQDPPPIDGDIIYSGDFLSLPLTATAAGVGVGPGYTSGAYPAAPYSEWRLVLTGRAESLRDEAVVVAAELSMALGTSFTVQAATVSPDYRGSGGEIVIDAATTYKGNATCGQTAGWIGCAGPDSVTDDFGSTAIDGAYVTVHSDSVASPSALTILEHEVGHGLGLRHFNSDYLGQEQVMRSQIVSGSGYRAGDLNGLRSQWDIAPTCSGLTATLWGSPRQDSITGTSGNDVIVGFDGNDVINAGSGTDTICGSGGDDVLNGEAGSDTIDGGLGFDTCSSTGDTTVACEKVLAYCDGLAVTIDMTTGASGHGTNGPDVILGTPGNDVIYGYGGNDVICGDLGIDTIYGGGGGDRIWGGGGSDYIYGQAGADTIVAGSGADRVYGGPAADTISGGGGQDFLWGEDGNDDIQGNHQSDKIYGGNGDDILRGAGGKDKLYGEAGNDTLYGGDNTDYLNGGSGTDSGNGQAGRDNPLIANVSGCEQLETAASC